VPDANGELVPPNIMVFDTLGWKPNPFLLSKIAFKPPTIDQLAKETGIDPAILDLLRKNPEVVAELVSRFVATKQQEEVEPLSDGEPKTGEPSGGGGDVYGDAKDLYGDDMPDIPPGTPDPDGGDGATGGSGRGGGRSNSGGGGGSGAGDHANRDGKGGGGQGKRSPGQTCARLFISYVGTHPDEDESDPDGIDQAARMQIEERAIALITTVEPALHRTPEGNPGFDLYETDSSGKQIRWVEVKSMTGSLEDRPVGLSHTQFACAREKGDAYWLYIVEHATDPAHARVLRIQNPFANARTFTFDRGWSEIARMEPPH
jgi:hypothetical protein